LLFLAFLEEEDALFVFEVVATGLPELRVIEIGRNDLLVSSDIVL
jgi:hypothetical protein